ncbi:uncharacterized protein QC761_104990 [Podospora bellae-mahoneyi]|uniref:Ecp2 effector protein domain-containing protein n=1 Tax=Podospora bellae-mahoneyi TaxID=2093777 RepID=A0ABR0FWK8_9PEZI|nr:hypothetical protein QC761_104990 [Podospora bellae-mahoneyi]
MLSKTILTIAAALAALTQIAQASQAPIPGYGVVDIQFDLPIYPGNATSETVPIIGTIEHAVAHMETLYPGWNESLFKLPSQRHFVYDDSDRNIIPESFNCWGRWKGCSWSAIARGIDYLWQLPIYPMPTNGPGPGNCGRVSCSYDSAIWWCNDNDFSKTVRWINISAGAEYMNGAFGSFWGNKGKCVDSDDGAWQSAGQAFYPGNFNVILNADKC